MVVPVVTDRGVRERLKAKPLEGPTPSLSDPASVF
jgi:hypothetical protein